MVKKLNAWIMNQKTISNRLSQIAILYLMFLMMPMRKHTLDAAAKFFNSNIPRFSKFLHNHADVAVLSLSDLSKKQAKQFAKVIKAIDKNGVPYKIIIIIDSTIQGRSSLHPQNSKRFNHGKGFVIGHQWTNVVIIINGKLIPLLPIPFFSKTYCRKNQIQYQTENEKVVEYIGGIHLEEYVGEHNPADVVVLADSGYDDQKIEKGVFLKGWNFIFALKNCRTFKTESRYLANRKSSDWEPVAEVFRKNRQVKWQTIQIQKNGGKKERKEFRVRQIKGFLKNFGLIQLVCSELKKGPKGRRKYLACNDLKATARQIVAGYRIRWQIEIFHKEVKMFMGFEDVSTKSFDSVISHVHWVYCAYILLKYQLTDQNEPESSVSEGQFRMKNDLLIKKILCLRQQLTRINGVNRFKSELGKVIEDGIAVESYGI